MTDDQRAIHAGLIALHNVDVTLRWSRTGIFLLLHSAGLTLMVNQMDKLEPESIMRLSLIGLTLAIVWVISSLQGDKYVGLRRQLIKQIEEKIDDRSIIRTYGKEYEKAAPRIFTHPVLIIFLACVFVVFWFCFFVFSLYQQEVL